MADRPGRFVGSPILLSFLANERQAHGLTASARDDDLSPGGRLLDQLAEMCFRFLEADSDHSDKDTTPTLPKNQAAETVVSRGRADASQDAEINVFKRIRMVEQLRGSWNPLLSWLRDVQAWSLGGRTEMGE